MQLSTINIAMKFMKLSFARNDSWMSYKIFTRAVQIYVLTTIEAEGKGWDPVKLS